MENNTLIALMGFVILLVVIVPQYISKNSENTITVQGEYEDSYYPDVAEFTISIETFAKEAKDAESQNKEISNSVINALKDSKIKNNDIETTSFNLNKKEECGEITTKESQVAVNEITPTNGEFRRYTCRQIGFTQTHMLKVTVYDIENIGKYVDIAVSAGATNVQNVNFRLSESKEAELKSKSLELASKNARIKAEAVAKGLKSKIKGVKSVSEVSYSYGPVYYAEAAMLKSSDTRIQPKMDKVSARVNVVFTIG